jgi:hypothetical protein
MERGVHLGGAIAMSRLHLVLGLLLLPWPAVADELPVSATVQLTLSVEGAQAEVQGVVERRLRGLAEAGVAPVTRTTWSGEGKETMVEVELSANPCKGRVLQCLMDAAAGNPRPACDDATLARWKQALEAVAARPGVLAFSGVLEEEQAALVAALRTRPELDGAYLEPVERGAVEVRADERAMRMAAASVKLARGRLAVTIDPGTEAGSPWWGRYYVLPATPDMEIRQVVAAEVRQDPDWEPQLSLTLKQADAEAFARLTERLVQRILVIELDGRVESAPVVMEPIRGGRASIVTCSPSAGPSCAGQAGVLAAVFGAGALPQPVTVTRVSGRCAE